MYNQYQPENFNNPNNVNEIYEKSMSNLAESKSIIDAE
jgi:hypothetical protein